MRSFLFLIFLGALLFQCSVFDSDKTVRLIKYTTPIITKAAITKDQIKLTININLNPTKHSDFSNYIVLIGTLNDNLSSVDNTDLGDMATLSQIPFYLKSSSKPILSSDSVNPLSITITTNLVTGQDYKIAVMAYGKNDTYGKLKNHNGWVVSKVSASKIIHKPLFSPRLTANFFNVSTTNNGYNTITNSTTNIQLTNYTGTDPTTLGYDIVFSSNNQRANNKFYISATTATTGGQLNYLQLPQNGSYTDLIPLPENISPPAGALLPLIAKSLYVFKKSNNTYQKIYIESITRTQVNFYVIYSTTTGKRNF